MVGKLPRLVAGRRVRVKGAWMSLQGTVYNQLRKLSPYPMRRWIKEQSWFVPLSRMLFGNEVYCKSYYDDVERLEKESVAVIGDWIVATLRPGTLIDVGCGPGHMMQALAQRGVRVIGVDVSSAAVEKVKAKGLTVQQFDLTAPGAKLPGGPYDLVLSCEVAEHLEEKHARRFVEHLTSAGSRVFLTASEPIPGQGVGLFHVNEQPNSYWIGLMRERGFELDQAATDSARETFQKGSVIDYLARPMIFRKSG